VPVRSAETDHAVRSPTKGNLLPTVTLTCAMVFGLSAPAAATELGGVELPDQIRVGEHTLCLNGIGKREVTVFGIDVYIAGLYLEEEMTDAAGILASRSYKLLDIHFVHTTTRARLRDAWTSALREAAGRDWPGYQAPLERLLEATPEMRDGESLSLLFSDAGVELQVNRKKKETGGDRGFAVAMLSMWIGPNAPNEKLRSQLLGAATGRSKR
jgi:hypothetical protein